MIVSALKRNLWPTPFVRSLSGGPLCGVTVLNTKNQSLHIFSRPNKPIEDLVCQALKIQEICVKELIHTAFNKKISFFELTTKNNSVITIDNRGDIKFPTQGFNLTAIPQILRIQVKNEKGTYCLDEVDVLLLLEDPNNSLLQSFLACPDVKKMKIGSSLFDKYTSFEKI